MPTALVVVDPLNDFISRRGKGYPLLRTVSGSIGLTRNMRRAMDAARVRSIPVVFAPHSPHSGRPTHRFPTPNQDLVRLSRFFSGFGGRFHKDLTPDPGEFVATPHSVSSGFGGTDLHEHLQSIGIDSIVICGLLTDTFIESTARHGVDLGYHVSVPRDAVAAWTSADHEAAVQGSLPLVVHDMPTTADFVS
ncbi:isochorismatase family cysteine hydrolase [Rhodococcus sp. SORGH_AS_0301]|uniref:isochorismatase family cysteine hydrolase n=1 Tax=Rhodococcus sp. SORGH_AS_0301 TaxID=3041780 RepID=UPI0027829B85|nr:isochorismatase family cysteine hydrolase [Rhodococcus sp. SORGH_AS_0301]MDQ1181813.1 nicotinamidase-related amidase [Rhodococcus sp. SORGH_AS_0301]